VTRSIVKMNLLFITNLKKKNIIKLA